MCEHQFVIVIGMSQAKIILIICISAGFVHFGLSIDAHHPYRKPLYVFNIGSEYDSSVWNSTLLHPEVQYRKVVVVSIVGAFRSGKSFFLDYCLRYLYANVSEFIFKMF